MAHRARSIQKSKKMTNGKSTIAIATVRRHEKNKFVYQVFFTFAMDTHALVERQNDRGVFLSRFVGIFDALKYKDPLEDILSM
jgi:hypothetical protein